MPKKTDALDNYKRRQKAVDELQVKELKRQSEKDQEHDSRIESLEKEHKNVKADVSQMKSDLESAIEAVKKAENSSKDRDQDEQLGKMQSSLLAEAIKLKALYESFELETERISELYDEIYSLKQRNISQSHIDAVQNIDSKDIAAKLTENKINDAEQSSDIAKNKNKISSNFKYIESVDKRLKKNSTNDKVTRVIAIVSLLGTIALALMEFLK